jgi:hypothetical protein
MVLTKKHLVGFLAATSCSPAAAGGCMVWRAWPLSQQQNKKPPAE